MCWSAIIPYLGVPYAGEQAYLAEQPSALALRRTGVPGTDAPCLVGGDSRARQGAARWRPETPAGFSHAFIEMGVQPRGIEAYRRIEGPAAQPTEPEES